MLKSNPARNENSKLEIIAQRETKLDLFEIE